jgi:hypothetical protein
MCDVRNSAERSPGRATAGPDSILLLRGNISAADRMLSAGRVQGEPSLPLPAFAIIASNEKYYLSYNKRASVSFASQIAADPRTFGLHARYRFGGS